MTISRLLIIALVLVCGACSNESREQAIQQFNTIYKQIKHPVDISKPDESIDLQKVMTGLDEQFATLGMKTHPPLRADEIAAQSAALPCPLPPMLVKMYQWHNGIDNLLPSYDFLPLSEMIKEYQAQINIAKQMGLKGDEGWPRHYLPVLRLDGKSYYTLDCSITDRSPLYDYFLEDGSAMPAYRGIGHLLAVTLSAFKDGAYFKHNGSILIHPIEYQQAMREHALPEELQVMDANLRVMNKGLTELNGLAFSYLANLVDSMADSSMIPILEKRLHDKNSITVSSAASALGDLHAKSAVPQLTDALSNPSSEVRNLAALALANIGHIDSPAVINKLVGLLHDKDDLVRLSAIEALGETHSSTAATALLAMLPDSRPGIQRSVIDNLGLIGDKRAIPALRDLLAKVSRMDLSKPDMGGTRGYDPPPAALKQSLETALKSLGG